MGKVKHVPANGGRAYAHLGTSITFKDEPDENDDGLFLYEVRKPAGAGVPPHPERNHEAFYVLEGRLRSRRTTGTTHSDRESPEHATRRAVCAPQPRARMGSGADLGVDRQPARRFLRGAGESIEDPLHPPRPRVRRTSRSSRASLASAGWSSGRTAAVGKPVVHRRGAGDHSWGRFACTTVKGRASSVEDHRASASSSSCQPRSVLRCTSNTKRTR